MPQHIINKRIVRDFYRRALGEGDVAFAEQVIADDYIQHSQHTGKPGKAGVLEAVQYLKSMPKPANSPKPFMRLIAEGDFVATNISFYWRGNRKAVVDIFRLSGGKLAEHWDAVQDEPATNVNGNALMDGPEEVNDLEVTESNKKIAADFYQQVWINRQLERLSALVAPDLIQHIPEIGNGIAGLKDYLPGSSQTFSVQQVHRIIGEGNFVVFQ